MTSDEKKLKALAACTDIAKSSGNADYSEYMRGMANGLILASAIMNDVEPEYLPYQVETVTTGFAEVLQEAVNTATAK